MAKQVSQRGGVRPPMNVYTAMLLLSFIALSAGCLILAIDLFSRRLPLKP